MPDDIGILTELCGSVYLTPEQKGALRRLLGKVARSPQSRLLAVKTTDSVTPVSTVFQPLLGPGDAQ